MAARKKRVSPKFKPSSPETRIEKPSVWQALNEPVVEVSGGFARGFLGVAVAFLMIIWIVPYWTQAASHIEHSVYRSPLTAVAGAQITEAPAWYSVAKSVPQGVVIAFAEASNEVLDVSGPVQQINEFFAPGVQAVGNAWIELMMDTY